MKKNPFDTGEIERLQFLGKINASISHELKNIFAIISETMGFIDDLTRLARQGKTLDLDILENCNNSIAEEIERGFHTIRLMNKLSHSADTPVKNTDITESLGLAIKLSTFLSNAIPVHIRSSDQRVEVSTNSFLLVCVFYRLLCELFKFRGKESVSFSIAAEKQGGAFLILSHLPNDIPAPFPSPGVRQTGNLLGIKWQALPDANALKLHIPSMPGAGLNDDLISD